MEGTERDRVVRIEWTWALDAVSHCQNLARIDPSWGATTMPVAGGHLVLLGPGNYVNSALGVGVATEFTRGDLHTIERAGSVVGVTPAVVVSPITDHSVAAVLMNSGYEPTEQRSVLWLDLHRRSVESDDLAIEIEHIGTDGLDTWQQAAAEGWGHRSPEARRSSDAYAAAAFESTGERLLLARDPASQEVLGCAAITIRSGLATLGGMSTRPSSRRQGVQSALVKHRLRLAGDEGCDVAVSSTVVDSDSERNLGRLGFKKLYEQTSYSPKR